MCRLKSLKTNVEKLVPFAAANSVEQFDAMQQSQSQVLELNKRLLNANDQLRDANDRLRDVNEAKIQCDHRIADMNWQLHELLNRNNFLEQELSRKSRELEKTKNNRSPRALVQVMINYSCTVICLCVIRIK